MPKYIMDSMDGVDPAVASLYTEENGKFTLTGISGISPKSTVDEFRNNNLELQNKLSTFEGIDPVAAKAQAQEINELKIRLERDVLDDDQINNIVASRTNAMTEEYATNVKGLNGSLNEANELISTLVIGNGVQSACIEHGIDPAAIEDVNLRAGRIFKVEGKEAVGYEGENKMYDATGTNLLTIGDWVKGLKETAPHLFKESVQSNIRGRRPGSGNTGNMSAIQKISSGL